VPLPLAFHHAFAWLTELTMVTPLLARAQARILAEGVVAPGPGVTLRLPADLAPATPFSAAQIRAGLPAPGPFTIQDLRCCQRSIAGAAMG
jgi:NADH dehydrogenase